jgi:hypothetical protein
VIYKKYLASVYKARDEEKLEGAYLFFTLMKNLHPILSLFLKFDPRHRRITRLATYLFQTSLATLIIILHFGESPREARDRVSDKMD